MDLVQVKSERRKVHAHSAKQVETALLFSLTIRLSISNAVYMGTDAGARSGKWGREPSAGTGGGGRLNGSDPSLRSGGQGTPVMLSTFAPLSVNSAKHLVRHARQTLRGAQGDNRGNCGSTTALSC